MKIHSQRMRALVCLLGGAGLAFVAGPARADSAAGGKSAAYLTNVLNLTTSPAFLGSVQLPKGKKKRILEVRATMVETTNSATALGVSASVNGVALEPVSPSAQAIESCTNSVVNCTTHGLWWLDLDQAEVFR